MADAKDALERWLDLCEAYEAARDGGPNNTNTKQNAEPLPDTEERYREMEEFGLKHGFKWRGL